LNHSIETLRAVGRAHTAYGTFWLFSLFCSELTASSISFSAEILGCDGSAKRKNSEALAVPPLFSAVLVNKYRSRQGGIPPKSVQRDA